MAGSIQGTKTEKNLMIAFANESMAVNRYEYFAKAAEKEGRKDAADAFCKTAEDERSHAGMLYKYFAGGSVEVATSFPAAVIADTKSNLEAAIAGEHATWTIRYIDFEKTAREEGFIAIADLFRQLAAEEKMHEERFGKLKGK